MLEETKMMKTTGLNLLKVIIIGALVFYGIRAPFEHKKYEYVNSEFSPEYLAHKAKYKPINQKRRKDLAENWQKLQSLINTENFSEEQKAKLQSIYNTDKNIIATSQRELQQYTKVKNELLAKYKYKGWNAYYYFKLIIGPHQTTFILALLLLYVIFNPITSKTKRLIFLLLTGAFLFSSTYFILQALYAQRVFEGDFPENWYLNIIRFVPVFVAIILPILFYYFQSIEQQLKTYIKSIFTYIYENVDDIKEEKRTKHKLKRGELINKGLKINV